MTEHLPGPGPLPPPSSPAPSRPSRGFPSAAAPLEAVAVAFDWLSAGPHPVVLDTTAFPGLPERAVRLSELRTRLLAPQCALGVREAVWAELIHRAQRPHPEGATWTLACAGMALPVLIRVSRHLTARFAGDPADIHAAVLTGFLHGVASVHPDQPRVLASLRWRAFRAGMAAVRDALASPIPTGVHHHPGAATTPPSHGRSVAQPPPAGHPDLVLARAVTDGILTTSEAALIGATRLERMPLALAARTRGQNYRAAFTTRQRAERRLLTYLTQPEPEPTPATTTGIKARGKTSTGVNGRADSGVEGEAGHPLDYPIKTGCDAQRGERS